jgi:hypothetical protein
MAVVGLCGAALVMAWRGVANTCSNFAAAATADRLLRAAGRAATCVGYGGLLAFLYVCSGLGVAAYLTGGAMWARALPMRRVEMESRHCAAPEPMRGGTSVKIGDGSSRSDSE